MTEWISVKDRLPEDFNDRGVSSYFLVFIDNPYFKNGFYHVAYLENGPYSKNWRGIESNVHHGAEIPNVTHWMPLPKPPKQ